MARHHKKSSPRRRAGAFLLPVKPAAPKFLRPAAVAVLAQKLVKPVWIGVERKLGDRGRTLGALPVALKLLPWLA